MVFVERVRTFSNGFISTATIAELAALTKFIIQGVKQYDPEIKVYSVDTRAWKSQILKDASASKDPAIRFVNDLLTLQRYGIVGSNQTYFTAPDVNGDEADAVCIGLYGMIKNPKLKEER